MLAISLTLTSFPILAATPTDAAIETAALPADERLAPSTLPLRFVRHEHVAFVGNSLAERMNLFGHFETLLHLRYPDLELVVRNFARPAMKSTIASAQQLHPLDDPLYVFNPDTLLCFFGFNESFAGKDGEEFQADYEKFLDEYAKKYPRARRARGSCSSRRSPSSRAATRCCRTARRRTRAWQLRRRVREIAKKRGFAFIDVFTPTEAPFAQQPGCSSRSMAATRTKPATKSQSAGSSVVRGERRERTRPSSRSSALR